MAFLGVIAEAMQILEDLAYVGESFTVNRFRGLPFYVGAITYNARVPTNFYGRKRTDEDLRVLAGYAVKDPASNNVLSVVGDLIADGVSAQARVAWRKAEDATTGVLRPAFDDLADTWTRFSKYFLAFKHGGLVAHRADFEIVGDDGAVVDPAIAVWMRRTDEPHAHGHAQGALDVREVVAELELRTRVAFDVLDLTIATRLSMAEQAAAGPPARADERMRIVVPARFRVGPETLSAQERHELEALGIRFGDDAGAKST